MSRKNQGYGPGWARFMTQNQARPLSDAIGVAMDAAKARRMVDLGVAVSWHELRSALEDEAFFADLAAKVGPVLAESVRRNARGHAAPDAVADEIPDALGELVDATADDAGKIAPPQRDLRYAVDGRAVELERTWVDGDALVTLHLSTERLEAASLPELVALVSPILAAEDVPLMSTGNATPALVVRTAGGVNAYALTFAVDGRELRARRRDLPSPEHRKPFDWATLGGAMDRHVLGRALVDAVRVVARRRRLEPRAVRWPLVASGLRDEDVRRELEGLHPTNVLAEMRRVAVGAARAPGFACPSCYEADVMAADWHWSCNVCRAWFPDDFKSCAVEHCPNDPDSWTRRCADHADPDSRPAW